MFMKSFIIIASTTATLFLSGCTTPTMEYRHVYLAETAMAFRYVDPREEIKHLKESELVNLNTFSLYLYEPTEGVPFNSTDFFTYLGDHLVYRHESTGAYYTREKSEIPDQIVQYYIEKEAHQSAT